MIAKVGGTGVIFRFTHKDRPILESGGTIETKFIDYLKPKLKFHVCDVVEREGNEIIEPGFKIHASPNGHPDQRTFYEVWISKEVAQRLLREGYCGTRCIIDRLEMTYWDL